MLGKGRCQKHPGYGYGLFNCDESKTDYNSQVFYYVDSAASFLSFVLASHMVIQHSLYVRDGRVSVGFRLGPVHCKVFLVSSIMRVSVDVRVDRKHCSMDWVEQTFQPEF